MISDFDKKVIHMTVKEKLRLMAAIKKANDKRAQEWAARRKGRPEHD